MNHKLVFVAQNDGFVAQMMVFVAQNDGFCRPNDAACLCVSGNLVLCTVGTAHEKHAHCLVNAFNCVFIQIMPYLASDVSVMAPFIS